MKPIRFILLALIFPLLLTACERPAPAGDIPAPVDNPEIVPRADEAYPAPATDETSPETAESGDTTTPADAAGETTAGDGETEPTAEETTTEGQATEEEVTDEPPPLEDGVYVVRSGDTLGQIAFIYGVTVEDIMAANGLTNPHILDVGQQLTIPEAGFAESQDAGSEEAASTPDEATDEAGEETIHVVRAGDNLFRIGLRYGFTVDELAEYNGIADVNSLEVGQEVRIPPGD